MMDLPDKKYQIILADPPWTYRDKANAGQRGVEYKYPTMSIDDIKNLSVSEIADTNCCLFMWVTFPLLQEGLDVMKAWGFIYRTIAFNWVKLTKKGKLFWGMGNWSRSNSEICLLGIKGSPKRLHANVHSIVQSPVREHSRKPDEVRDRIVQLCGDLPRIELFGRTQTPGWDVWGSEVNKFA